LIVAVPNLIRIKVVSHGLESGQCDLSVPPDSLCQFTDVVRFERELPLRIVEGRHGLTIKEFNLTLSK